MATESVKRQSRVKELIAKGKEQGYLTYAEVNDHLPDDISDPDQIEDIISMINDMGITVYESAEAAPDADELLNAGDNTTDELAAEEAAAALAAVETETGRTTDPVRMYMREMGTVELLTREGEIAIAKRIEEGIRDVLQASAYFPAPSPTFWTVSRTSAEMKSCPTFWWAIWTLPITCPRRRKSISRRSPRTRTTTPPKSAKGQTPSRRNAASRC